MSQAKGATRAADLAERIIDEVSRSGQDWRAIELHAHRLAELAASLCRASASRAQEPVGR